MQAKAILDKAEVLLLDPTNVRWPRNQLLDYLNDGQREVVIYRPDASMEDRVVALVDASTRQTLPANGLRLLDVVRNMGTDGATPGAPLLTGKFLTRKFQIGMAPNRKALLNIILLTR